MIGSVDAKSIRAEGVAIAGVGGACAGHGNGCRRERGGQQDKKPKKVLQVFSQNFILTVRISKVLAGETSTKIVSYL